MLMEQKIEHATQAAEETAEETISAQLSGPRLHVDVINIHGQGPMMLHCTLEKCSLYRQIPL